MALVLLSSGFILDLSSNVSYTISSPPLSQIPKASDQPPKPGTPVSCTPIPVLLGISRVSNIMITMIANYKLLHTVLSKMSSIVPGPLYYLYQHEYIKVYCVLGTLQFKCIILVKPLNNPRR